MARAFVRAFEATDTNYSGSGFGDLLRELSGYACAPSELEETTPQAPESAVGVPFRIITSAGELSFFSMTTVFGTPVDVTLAELALEFFFPLDEVTVERVRLL